MCKVLIFVMLILTSTTAVGQQHKPQINKAPDVENAGQRSGILTVPRTEIPRPSIEVGFPTTIPVTPPERREVRLSDKFEDFKEKNKLIYATPPNVPPAGAVVNPLKLKLGLDANRGDTSAPLDNTVSVSNEGDAVSVSNGIIEFYKDGSLKYRASLRRFLGNKLKGPCDPKVLFDPLEKKFIFFAQRCEDQYSESQIIVGFSATSSPLDQWNFYILNGNPLDKPTYWFDYPKIGISKDGLFISGHIFDGNNTLQETVVYQIDKGLGFKGTDLNYIVWRGLADNPIILQPITFAFNDLNGNGAFLIGTVWQEKSSYVRLYDISGSIKSSPQMRLYKIPTPEYYFFAKAVQKNQPIDNGDIRIQDAVLLDGKIAFVFTSGLQDRRFSRINFNILDLSSLTVQSRLLGDNVNHSYAFPSIGLISNKDEPASFFILYNGTSDNSFPDIRYKVCDIKLSCSVEFLLKPGESTINNHDRWGDYSGIAKQNTKRGELWLASTYGKNDTRQTFLANVISSTGPNDFPTSANLSPPAIQSITFIAYEEHDVKIVLKKDGIAFRTFKEVVTNGRNNFQLFTRDLEKGIYQIDVISRENKLIKSETFTKED